MKEKRSLQATFVEWMNQHAGRVDEDKLASAIDNATRSAGDVLAGALLKGMPEMLRDHRRMHGSFHGRLRRTWGRALDLHSAVVVATMEFGEHLVKEAQERQPDAADSLAVEVLVDLHAQACRVALEVHALLDSGFPVGAQARGRTIHELAVVAMLIGAHADTDLPVRYRDHHVVDRARDAESYAEHYRTLGYEPFDADTLVRINADRDRAVTLYGKAFAGRYGWAASLRADGKAPSFQQLEHLAGVSHLHPFYLWACHGVHAGSRGAVLNSIEFRGERVRMAGHTNAGLADPGHLSLISLQQVTASLVARRTFVPTLDDLVYVRAIMALVDRAGDAFIRGHRRLERLERRFQRLAEAQRTTPERGGTE